MHINLVPKYIQHIKDRHTQGDCPTIAPLTIETMENLILTLEHQLNTALTPAIGDEERELELIKDWFIGKRNPAQEDDVRTAINRISRALKSKSRDDLAERALRLADKLCGSCTSDVCGDTTAITIKDALKHIEDLK